MVVTYHIVWTTFLEWPVWDRRGGWAWLKDVYSPLQSSDFETSREFASEYDNRASDPSTVQLAGDEISQVCADIAELCEHDRIASQNDDATACHNTNAHECKTRRANAGLSDWRLTGKVRRPRVPMHVQSASDVATAWCFFPTQRKLVRHAMA